MTSGKFLVDNGLLTLPRNIISSHRSGSSRRKVPWRNLTCYYIAEHKQIKNKHETTYGTPKTILANLTIPKNIRASPLIYKTLSL
ncbi:hypothetical protein H5410_045966 [Solanum commersonii]|uniref:Uncharacterized protein n=1 Tax=Solanum commersonii TaxID=4109 RepID=A0A9J5XE89_SOLCO|nr:hypothetical protein H5410_045966 [Solanum commersonii]